MHRMNTYWQLITQLGSSSLLMPILIIGVIGLLLSRQKKAVYLWIFSLGIAVSLTLLSKILFLGWGIGIVSLDFTGISGHTMLATSILPLLFFSVEQNSTTKFRNIGLWFGLLLSLAVGISRVVLGMHSISEVVAGWIFGLVVCFIAVNAIKSHRQGVAYLQLTILILVLAFGSMTPNYIPAHESAIKLALYLSGHDKPYTRADLLKTKA